MKESKGITLIALIITIIIMLILAAVVIAIIIDGGLFESANKAAELTDIAQTKEAIQTDILGILLTGDEIIPDDLRGELEKILQRHTSKYVVPAIEDGTIKFADAGDKAYETKKENPFGLDDISLSNIGESLFPDVKEWIPIYEIEHLVAIGTDDRIEIKGKYYTFSIDENYMLMNDLDLEGTQWNPRDYVFEGIFYGKNNTITGMSFNGTTGNNYGLFRRSKGAIAFVKLEDVNVQTDSSYIGGIVGINEGTVMNCTVEGNIKGNSRVGGLIRIYYCSFNSKRK